MRGFSEITRVTFISIVVGATFTPEFATLAYGRLLVPALVVF
jgi:hypothetical protein